MVQTARHHHGRLVKCTHLGGKQSFQFVAGFNRPHHRQKGVPILQHPCRFLQELV